MLNLFRLLWNVVDQIPNRNDVTKDPVGVLPFSQAVMVQNKKARLMLSEFLSDKSNQTHFMSMVDLLKKENSEVGHFLSVLYDEELEASGHFQKVYRYSFYGVWKVLLSVFATGEKLQFFLHPKVVVHLHNYLLHKITVVQFVSSCTELCLLLCNILSTLQAKELPAHVHKLLSAMVSICRKAYLWLYTVADDDLLQLCKPQTQPQSETTREDIQPELSGAN